MLNPNQSSDRIWYYIFYTFMLSVVFLFSVGLFLLDFLDIARYACKKSDEKRPMENKTTD